jgi:hypothetical protein
LYLPCYRKHTLALPAAIAITLHLLYRAFLGAAHEVFFIHPEHPLLVWWVAHVFLGLKLLPAQGHYLSAGCTLKAFLVAWPAGMLWCNDKTAKGVVAGTVFANLPAPGLELKLSAVMTSWAIYLISALVLIA